jgi:hypothetical protein
VEVHLIGGEKFLDQLSLRGGKSAIKLAHKKCANEISSLAAGYTDRKTKNDADTHLPLPKNSQERWSKDQLNQVS